MDADLVLEGGGVKGIGLVGALKVFGDAGYRFRRVAGTSAGAIVGSLAAAGVPPDQLQRIMQELDYRKFQDGDFLSHVGVRTWGDLRITREDDPGSALEPERSYKLVVIVSDISDNRLLRLPWDYD